MFNANLIKTAPFLSIIYWEHTMVLNTHTIGMSMLDTTPHTNMSSICLLKKHANRKVKNKKTYYVAYLQQGRRSSKESTASKSDAPSVRD